MLKCIYFSIFKTVLGLRFPIFSPGLRLNAAASVKSVVSSKNARCPFIMSAKGLGAANTASIFPSKLSE